MTEVISSYSASDGKKLFYRGFTAHSSNIGPCLILIHGIESHSEWFREACENLTAHGIEVFALDRRGSGLNKEDRGDIADFNRLIQDIDDFFLEKKLKHRKCVLAGLCWGAKTSLYFSLCYPGKISKIVFITPGFKTKLRMPIAKKIKWVWGALFTPHTLLSLPIKPGMFTKDEARINRITEDKMRLKNITGRFFKENLRLERAIKKLKAWVDMPCLLLLAKKDEIVDNKGVIKFLKRYFRGMEIKFYSGSKHGLFFEHRKDEVIQDMAEWCFDLKEKI